MESLLTIIDAFEVTQSLAKELGGLALGKWHVLEGIFPSEAGLPKIGSWVEIQVPKGERLQVVVSGCEVRHGTAALAFVEPEVRIPRMSTIRRIGV